MAAITHVQDCYQGRLDSPMDDNNGIQDIHLEEEFPDTNFNNLEAHYAGLAGTKPEDYLFHAIFLYDLPAFIPAGAIIIAAVWWFYVQYTDAQPDHAFTVHRLVDNPLVGIPADWKENEATWNDRLTGVAWATPGGGATTPAVVIGAITENGWQTPNILTIVADAWDNRSGILHLLVRRSDAVNEGGYISISGKEQFDTHPQSPHHLRITYTLDGRTFQVMLR